MKLKKAVRRAKKQGFNWIAVDSDLFICMYEKKPAIQGMYAAWTPSENSGLRIICGKRYTGKKSWNKTLRQVL